MALWLKMLIGLGIGLLAGGALGYVRKRRADGAIGGALLGAIVGALIAAMAGGSHETPTLSPEQFEQRVLKARRPVLVDFYADWCPSCRILAPTIDTLHKEYKDRADVVKIDVDKAKELARQHNIETIPAVILFVGGREVRRWIGIVDASEYRAALDSAIKGQKP